MSECHITLIGNIHEDLRTFLLPVLCPQGTCPALLLCLPVGDRTVIVDIASSCQFSHTATVSIRKPTDCLLNLETFYMNVPVIFSTREMGSGSGTYLHIRLHYVFIHKDATNMQMYNKIGDSHYIVRSPDHLSTHLSLPQKKSNKPRKVCQVLERRRFKCFNILCRHYLTLHFLLLFIFLDCCSCLTASL